MKNRAKGLAKTRSNIDVLQEQVVMEAVKERGLLGLVEQICKAYHVTAAEICGRGRTKNVSRARREVWWRIRHDPNTRFSTTEIGAIFGRDHSTIVLALAVYAAEHADERAA